MPSFPCSDSEHGNFASSKSIQRFSSSNIPKCITVYTNTRLIRWESSDSGSGSSAPSSPRAPSPSVFNPMNFSAEDDDENSTSTAAISSMFGDATEKTSGSRLGISYVRAQKPILEVLLGTEIGQTLALAQDVADEEAISGVVWDAGLLMIDYLVTQKKNVKETWQALIPQPSTDPRTGSVFLTHIPPVRYVLDLGCGTGVVGLVASALSSSSFSSSGSATVVYFSDKPSTEHLAKSNMANSTAGSGTGGFDANSEASVSPSRTFIAFDWLSGEPPPAALCCPLGDDSCSWDIVYCSDVLYDDAVHIPLMQLLQKIQFKKVVFSYKKRYPGPERTFFQLLHTWCDLRVVPVAKKAEASETNGVHLLNCTEAMTKAGGGLYIVEATPRS